MAHPMCANVPIYRTDGQATMRCTGYDVQDTVQDFTGQATMRCLIHLATAFGYYFRNTNK